jgi:tRNA(Ser,Leu) C12 N-acetylase TAN1
MSSVELMISEIEKDYNDILKSLEKNVDLTEKYYRFKEISEDELLELLRKTIKFQRSLEYLSQQRYLLRRAQDLISD